MADTFQKNVNNYTKNKYALVLSNVPNLTVIPDEEIDLAVFNTSVKSVELPNITLSLLHSYWQHEDQKHPNPQGARDTNTMNVEWILDSKFMNYLIFASWAQGSRYGIPAREPRPELGEALLRDNCIDRIDVYSLDNTGFPTSKLSFHRAFLTGIGNLPLEFGDASIVTFQTTFEYEKFGLTIQQKLPDGTWAIEPLKQPVVSKA
jgi:hypothetical protein